MSPRPRLAALAVVVGLVVTSVGSAGCSGSDDGDAAAPSTSAVVPSSSGDRCDDPTGDLDVPAGVPPEVLPALAGIDLVTAEATVEGEQLAVRFEVVGPVADVPDPTFVVAQGDPLDPLSFELRIARRADQWQVTLITWPDAREKRQLVAAPVTAADGTVAVDVPLAGLPPIALTLQFGATAEVSPSIVVFDDCSNLNPG
ncbi:MAG: hypothetical protein MUE36_11090 [Acidimicrobiales bacterium]|jgi:hypothetical protein|nr:hypothetical protein [Acidimicrobiales bacterium]